MANKPNKPMKPVQRAPGQKQPEPTPEEPTPYEALRTLLAKGPQSLKSLRVEHNWQPTIVMDLVLKHPRSFADREIIVAGHTSVQIVLRDDAPPIPDELDTDRITQVVAANPGIGLHAVFTKTGLESKRILLLAKQSPRLCVQTKVSGDKQRIYLEMVKLDKAPDSDEEKEIEKQVLATLVALVASGPRHSFVLPKIAQIDDALAVRIAQAHPELFTLSPGAVINGKEDYIIAKACDGEVQEVVCQTVPVEPQVEEPALPGTLAPLSANFSPEQIDQLKWRPSPRKVGLKHDRNRRREPIVEIDKL